MIGLRLGSTAVDNATLAAAESESDSAAAGRGGHGVSPNSSCGAGAHVVSGTGRKPTQKMRSRCRRVVLHCMDVGLEQLGRCEMWSAAAEMLRKTRSPVPISPPRSLWALVTFAVAIDQARSFKLLVVVCCVGVGCTCMRQSGVMLRCQLGRRV